MRVQLHSEFICQYLQLLTEDELYYIIFCKAYCEYSKAQRNDARWYERTH